MGLFAPLRSVLAIGAANMDITGSSVHPLVAHDSTPGQVRCAPGGVARNVAENLARLGLDVGLLCVVGDDVYGASVIESTRRAGVDVQGCQVVSGHATSAYLSLHGPDGDMALALNDMAILDQFTPERLAVNVAALRDAGAVVVDCNLPETSLAWIVAQAGDAPLFVEPVSAFKCRRMLPWLEQIHTIKANRIEAQALTGLVIDTDDAVVAAARWLHRHGLRQLVLSLGARGLYWSERGGTCGWQPALTVPVVNATGAGDAMMAGLVYGWVRGDTLRHAVVFATGCAALTLTAPQANHPNLSVTTVRQLFPAAARAVV